MKGLGLKNGNKIFLHSLTFLPALGWLLRNDKIDLEANKTISAAKATMNLMNLERSIPNFPIWI
jgi:hypothetical protein